MSFEGAMQELLEATNASRTTLRLDMPGEVFPVLAEALAPGIRSIRSATEIDLRKAKTFQFLARERRLLIQADCLIDEPLAPPELIDLYGVRAQMLAPIVKDGELAGIISVHHAGAPRKWTEAEIGALEAAVDRVLADLA